jgi:hypothetical protein
MLRISANDGLGEPQRYPGQTDEGLLTENTQQIPAGPTDCQKKTDHKKLGKHKSDGPYSSWQGQKKTGKAKVSPF